MIIEFIHDDDGHHPGDQCDTQEDFSLFTVSVDLDLEPSRQFLLPNFEETISLQVLGGAAGGLVGSCQWERRSGFLCSVYCAVWIGCAEWSVHWSVYLVV